MCTCCRIVNITSIQSEDQLDSWPLSGARPSPPSALHLLLPLSPPPPPGSTITASLDDRQSGRHHVSGCNTWQCSDHYYCLWKHQTVSDELWASRVEGQRAAGANQTSLSPVVQQGHSLRSDKCRLKSHSQVAVAVSLSRDLHYSCLQSHLSDTVSVFVFQEKRKAVGENVHLLLLLSSLLSLSHILIPLLATLSAGTYPEVSCMWMNAWQSARRLFTQKSEF